MEFVSHARASRHPRAFLHPGGLQWLLRRLGSADFAARQWTGGNALAGFVIDDKGYVIVQAASPTVEAHLRLLQLAEEGRRAQGHHDIEVSVWDDDRELAAALRSLGYEPSAGHDHLRR